MQLTLFYGPQTCATVPYITLTEAGARFDVRNINSRSGQNRSPEFLALNPKHKVPVLVIDGEPLTENVAIQIWIARQFPHARLLPADPREEIKAISLMSWCASGIHPHLTPNEAVEKVSDHLATVEPAGQCEGHKATQEATQLWPATNALIPARAFWRST